MKAVLTKWCESILDIPKLVQLGYGGVMAPIVAGDEDDVSSYGVEEDRLLTQKPGGDTTDADKDVEQEPMAARQGKRDSRRTSFADEVLNSRQHIPSRYLPSKSPRMRMPDERKKSSRSNAEEAEDLDDDSNTQDPTSTVNQHGGATPDDKETTSPKRAVPIRDSDEEGDHGGFIGTIQSTPSRRFFGVL